MSIKKTEHIASDIQMRFWIEWQKDKSSTAYQVTLSYTVCGNIDVEKLQQALNYVLSRHEALRSTYRLDGDTLKLILHEAIRVPIQHVVIQDESPELVVMKRDALLKNVVMEPFDLSVGPLIRFGLLSLSPSHHEIHLCFAHMIFDGQSLHIFQKELTECYRAYCMQEEPLLDPAPSYIEHLQTLSQRIDENHNEDKRYWDCQFESAPTSMTFPSFGQSSKGPTRSHYFQLSDHLMDKLQQYSKNHKVTIFELAISAWVVLLHRYTGLSEQVLCYQVNLFRQPLVGCAINTLPVYMACDGETNFSTSVSKFHAHRQDARKHQYYPISSIVRKWYQDGKIKSHESVLNIGFGATNLRNFDWQLHNTEVHSISPLPIDAIFDLILEYESLTKSNEFRVTGRASAYPMWYLEQIASDYVNCLEEALDSPHLPVSKMEWFGNSIPFVSPASSSTCGIHLLDIFRENVTKFGSAIAIESGEQTLTYQQLDEFSDNLAHVLQSTYTEDDKTPQAIGILSGRKMDGVIATLAVIKTGAVYVPLNVDDPISRISKILTDAACRVLLMDDNTHFSQTEMAVIKEICPNIIMLSDASIETHNGPFPKLKLTHSHRPIYIMYTSGSTGTPKGVVIPEKGIVRLVVNTNYVTLYPSDRVALASNPAFDASTFEIWSALLNGSALIEVNKAVLLDTKKLKEYLCRQNISVLCMTMSLFHQHVSNDPRCFQSLRVLLLGGEVLNPVITNKMLHLEGAKPKHLLHLYGPTENTTYTTFYEINEPLPENQSVPIGKSISATQCFILDNYGVPVPFGVPGQLYVSGDGVALGYHHKPELSHQSFVSPPRALANQGMTNDLLYRTGDLARWLEDGNIEFLGRLDTLVKVRGFRVELGEIENSLVKHPAIQNATVIIREENGIKSLHAFYVSRIQKANQSVESDNDNIRRYLMMSLPEYMVPATITAVDQIPTNRNGKVDQNALRHLLERSEAKKMLVISRADFSAMTRNEQSLYKIWCGLFGHENIALEDSFFSLGGHSLLLLSMVAKVRSQLGVDLCVDAVIEKQTIRSIALLLDQQAPGDSHELSLNREPQSGKLPLSQFQKGHWYLIRHGKTFNCFYAVHFHQQLQFDILRQAINRVVQRHEAFWIRVDMRKPMQEVHQPRSVNVETPIILGEMTQAEELKFLERFAADCVKRKMINTLPAAEFAVIQSQKDSWYVTLTMPHILVDGYSLNKIMSQVEMMYRAIKNQQDIIFDEPTLKIREYLQYEQQTIIDSYIQAGCHYYESKMQGDATFLIPRAILSKEVSGYNEKIPEHVFSSLEKIAHEISVSVESLLVYCGFLTVHAVSGNSVVRCFSAFNNRDRDESKDLNFMMANGVLNQSTLSPGAIFRQSAMVFCKQYLQSLSFAKLPPLILFSMSRLLFLRKRIKHYFLPKLLSTVWGLLSGKKMQLSLCYELDLVISSLIYGVRDIFVKQLRPEKIRTTGCLINVTSSLSGQLPNAAKGSTMRHVHVPVPVPETVPGSPMLEIYRDSSGVNVFFQACYDARYVEIFINIFQNVCAVVAENKDASICDVMGRVDHLVQLFHLQASSTVVEARL